MPRKSKTPELRPDAPATVQPAAQAAPPVQEKAPLPALGHIQSELADLCADFICYGGWNDSMLQAFILLCMKNRWYRRFKEHAKPDKDGNVLPQWIKEKAVAWTRELVRETVAFPELKPGEAPDGAPVKERFKARTRYQLGTNLQDFLDTANVGELAVMEEVMAMWDSNNVNMLVDDECPILHALDLVIRNTGSDQRFIKVPERFEDRVYSLVEALHAAEKAAEVK